MISLISTTGRLSTKNPLKVFHIETTEDVSDDRI